MAKVIKVNTSKNGKITSVAAEPKTGVKTNTSKTTENVKSGTSNVSKVSNSTSQSTSTKSNTSENFFTAFKNLLTGNKSTSNTSTSLVSKPSSAPNNYSTPGVGQNTYDETLKNIRLMTSAAMSKNQKQKIAEDMLARSRFSDEQIEKALKSLGLN